MAKKKKASGKCANTAMSKANTTFSIEVEDTKDRCPIGEITGNRNMAENKITVLSCEGACIRGEIARLAANLVAKGEPFARACHGELLSVPDSAMAQWVKKTKQVVVIDGCFLRCHGRIIVNLIAKGKLLQFDALSVYKKYSDLFEIDDVSQEQRKEAAQQVAENIMTKLKAG